MAKVKINWTIYILVCFSKTKEVILVRKITTTSQKFQVYLSKVGP